MENLYAPPANNYLFAASYLRGALANCQLGERWIQHKGSTGID